MTEVVNVKILIISYHNCFNKGEASILNSMLEALHEAFPEAKFTMLSLYPKIDPARHSAEVLPTIPTLSQGQLAKIEMIFQMFQRILWTILYGVFKLNANALVREEIRRTLQAYAEADIILSRGNDCLTDAHPKATFLLHIYDIFLTTLLRKPVVIYAHTVGPFKNDLKGRIYKFLTKTVLNRVDLITVREEFSRELLREMNVTRSCTYMTADSAFIMRSASQRRVKEILYKAGIDKKGSRPLIGMTTSHIYRYGFPEVKSREEKYRRYVKMMRQVIDYLTDKLDATLVLVPHVFLRGYDDRTINEDIYQNVKRTHMVKLMTDEYTPEELKGIIGQFDLFISSRTHPIIHALSMQVPVIGIDYTSKAKAIMKMFGQEEWAFDIKALDFDSLVSKISALYSIKDKIRGDLAFRIKTVQEYTMLNVKLVKVLVESLEK